MTPRRVRLRQARFRHSGPTVARGERKRLSPSRSDCAIGSSRRSPVCAIARLKGGPGRPNIKPSGMDKATEPKPPPAAAGEPRATGSKTSRLSIHEEQTVKLAAPPRGSRFKGYTSFVVQDLVRVHLPGGADTH